MIDSNQPRRPEPRRSGPPRASVRREARSPVSLDERGSVFDKGRGPRAGIALCLSGGGYRAMLFHAGALWRLNEIGYLRRLNRVSSVSGGSIAAGLLGLRWKRLWFNDADDISTNFNEEIIAPLRALAGRTLDVGAVLGGLLTFSSIADRVAKSYRTHLFGDATLQALPVFPRFVINATNVQTGALWRFSRPFMGDHRVGLIRNPTVPLADAVAASSAFPPVLSPMRLSLDPSTFERPTRGTDLDMPPYTTQAVLTDGGVYDNLGLETAWKRFTTILVSDGGGRTAPDPHPRANWAAHAVRVNQIIDNQVRALRKRQLISSYRLGERAGTYWGIRSLMGNDFPPGALPCPETQTLVLANIPTRLKRMDAYLQERLINWGYAICDAAMRTHVAIDAPPPARFPYPGGVGENVTRPPSEE